MLHDLRLACRSLARQRWLTAAVVVTVAAAIAVNTSLFSVFDGLLFRPLPYPDADRLVAITLPPGTAMSVEERRQATDALGATSLFSDRAWARMAILFEEGSESVTEWGLRAVQVSPNLFPMTGVAARHGRLLTTEDEGAVTPRPVLISDDLWRARFGGDPSVVGRTITMPGMIHTRPFLLVGVLPRGFGFPEGANVWVLRAPGPFAPDYARLAPGVTIEQVRSRFPKVTVTPLREHVRPRGAFALGVLLAATGLLLLVAWVQVAALLFARAAGRAPEIGVRLSLGATRARLVRQFVAEGAMAALTSLGLAWIVTPSLAAVVARLLPPEMTLGQSLAPDGRTFGFACALSLAGVLLLAVVPVEIVRRTSPLDLLRGDMFGRLRLGAARLRTALLVGQIAVTSALLYMAGLAVHSFARVTTVDPGFVVGGVVVAQMPAMVAAGKNPQEIRAGIDRQVRQFEEAMEALRALPGVAAVGAGRPPFLESRMYSPANAWPVTTSRDPEGRTLEVVLNYARGDYLRVLGVRLLDGHVPAESDLQGGATLSLVNETLARQLEAFGPPVGQVLTANSQKVTVVGVVADFAQRRPDAVIQPEALIFRKTTTPWLVARLAQGDDQTLAAVRATLHRIWSDRPVREVTSLSDALVQATAEYRARSVLLALLGLLCLPLGVTGISGALGYATRQRAREVAIHVALGAEPARIRRRIVRSALGIAGGGLVLGLGAGLGLGRWMSTYLFGVRPADPVTAAGVAAVLLVVAWLAARWPARAASRVDPSVALRDI